MKICKLKLCCALRSEIDITWWFFEDIKIEESNIVYLKLNLHILNINLKSYYFFPPVLKCFIKKKKLTDDRNCNSRNRDAIKKYGIKDL